MDGSKSKGFLSFVNCWGCFQPLTKLIWFKSDCICERVAALLSDKISHLPHSHKWHLLLGDFLSRHPAGVQLTATATTTTMQTYTHLPGALLLLISTCDLIHPHPVFDIIPTRTVRQELVSELQYRERASTVQGGDTLLQYREGADAGDNIEMMILEDEHLNLYKQERIRRRRLRKKFLKQLKKGIRTRNNHHHQSWFKFSKNSKNLVKRAVTFVILNNT